MKVVSWNGRGLGNRAAERGLLDVRKREDPDVLFLSETKLDEQRLQKFRWLLGMPNMAVYNCNGKSGGLALLWKRDVDVSIRDVKRLYIDANISDGGVEWRFTGVYGDPENKELTWTALRNLKQKGPAPWLCMGDFNEILFQHEKVGGAPKPQTQLDRFLEAIEFCELTDLGFIGDIFTWRNHSHRHDRYIKECLDRAVANIEWRQIYPAVKIINGEPRHSDHRPVILDTSYSPAPTLNVGHEFCFEAAWLQEDSCAQLVQDAWNDVVDGSGSAAERIKKVASRLQVWNCNVLGDLQKRIKKTKKELNRCLKDTISEESVHREHVLRFKLERLEDQCDIYWRQRAHVDWLKHGDRNTRFFHSCCSERKRRNRITKLKKEDGEIIKGQEELKQHISNYYKSLFTAQPATNLSELLEHVQPRVTDYINDSLCSPFTEEEIFEALQNIGDLKAPGPDGMPAIFYKRFWEVVGDRVKNEVLQVLNGGPVPADWNNTTVVLIPKVKHPECIKDLRPISLCNVIYKIVSKVLTSRLKVFLGDIISQNQSAFVPGRLITDNVLVAYEMTHFIKNKRSGDGYMAVKLDMSKAYDRVEWNFLEAMLVKLGFNSRWVSLLMKCVRSVTYKIKVNGELTEVIHPQRGLRQGDPLSPYLFLIVAEGFSSLLHTATQQGLIEGIKICPAAPSVSHLLFADDSLLLLKADCDNATELQRILDQYEACSGQVINREKSTALFSPNCNVLRKAEILDCLNMTSEGANEKYLGLPVYIGRARKRMFQYLKGKIWARIQGWKEKILSKAGKEILIKAVAQAIPTFAMSCFDLTKELCDEISAMICKFWWSQMDKETKLHWLSWESLSKPKKDGGLGFRDLHSFNIAMLAKQAWRILINPDSMCAKLLQARYFPAGDFLGVSPTGGISYTWRSILKGRDLIKQGLIWRVGDGLSINIWEDPWVPRGITRRPSTHRDRHQLLERVCDLISPVTGQWDQDLVRQTFNGSDAEVILTIPIQEGFDDFPAWHPDPKGVFSVRSAYKLRLKLKDVAAGETSSSTAANPTTDASSKWKRIWSLNTPRKISMFLWRLGHNSLPVKMNLRRRGVELDTLCPMCHRLDEDCGHIFLKCRFAKSVWREANLESIREELLHCTDALQTVDALLKLDENSRLLSITLLWKIWSARNSVNVGDKSPGPAAVASTAIQYTSEFTSYLCEKPDVSVPPTVRWTQPPEDFLKINIDGSFCRESNTGGWGFCIRDCNGEVCGAGMGQLVHVADALHAEAIACLKAIEFAADAGMGHIIIETDATLLKSALQSSEFDSAHHGVLFREAKFLLFTNFLDYKVLYCKRSCNKVAHVLAANGASLASGGVMLWHDHVPDAVSHIVASELAATD